MLQIYNTLTRKIEDFKPQNATRVTMYSCGPTVYDYQHIGHMRRYIGDDLLVRILALDGYTVDHVMNLTDVGHLVSDDDAGEDKMEKGAKKFGMSVWDTASKFTQQFFDSTDSLNIIRPNKVLKATDCIKEQIALIETLEQKGFTYKIADGIYFDSSKLSDYGKLTGQKAEELKAGARVEMVEGKKSRTDFALWKLSPVDEKRQMEWESPWGVGFPGWHIECSAMAMSALGETLDIHTGGIDHIPVHHTNEIAQSEAATGKPFVKYWVHHNFLQVEGQKMSKSLGNFYTVQDVIEKGFDPMALRYLYLQTHYRAEMNFTWDSLKAAQTALDKLKNDVKNCHPERSEGSRFFGKPQNDIYRQKFTDALADDMNTPKALAVVWELIKSEENEADKIATIKLFDSVLGLELFQQKDIKIPEKIRDLVEKRKKYREEKDYKKSDELRDEILGLGYEVLDGENGESTIKKP
ncbi:MAG: cysteine--tRNA ligase [Candidatus Levybacteria bacterium]|nr:cysteine--tRNA ligase [Candidatus Levybacteria bacterium]